jgi:hypothetical protein
MIKQQETSKLTNKRIFIDYLPFLGTNYDQNQPQ